jgi:hypothetical protein
MDDPAILSVTHLHESPLEYLTRVASNLSWPFPEDRAYSAKSIRGL